MNILQVNTVDTGGGAASVAYSLGSELRKRGVKVNYIVGKKYSQDKRVICLPRNPVFDLLEKLSGKDFGYFFKDLLAYIIKDGTRFGAKKKILNNKLFNGADVVHLHNLHGYYFRLSTISDITSKKPTVWTLHDRWILDQSKKVYAMINDCHNLTLVSPSKWLIQKIKEKDDVKKPVVLINNGVDTSVFALCNKINCRKKYNLPLDKKIVGYVGHWGTLNKQKGAGYFSDTARHFLKNNKVIFLCIGGIKGKRNIQKDNVIYTPFISDDYIMAEYYSCLDVIMFSSLNENFPLTTLEAMSVGVPIVSFDVGGVKEQVDHKENGYLVKYKDQKDLEHGLEWVLNLSRDKLKKMSIQNRNKALSKYSTEEMCKNYIKLYDSLLRN